MGNLLGASRSASSSAINPMAQQFIRDTIAKQKVVIFSKSYCPYCTMAKEVSF
jgi:glutaredoxin 3